MKNIKIVSPRYQQIAIDIASKIAAREYQVGEKIYSRSIIAGNYGVLSETARSVVRQCEEIETLGGLKQQIQAEIRQ